ncbi:MAG TPA: glycosyltransferase family 2 protein, partial [Vicinamibacteria bacterium]
MAAAARESFAEGCRVALESFLASGARLRWEAVEEPLVSVVLVLFNRAELTLRCLRSIAEERRIPLEIILVDNASTDQTEALLERLDGVRVIRNAENRGFVLAVNQAARRARGRYLLLLNNDTELLPDALTAAVAVLQGSEDVGAVGGKVLSVDGRLQEAGSIVWNDGSCLGYGRGDDPFAAEYMFRRDVDFCSGAFLLTPR